MRNLIRNPYVIGFLFLLPFSLGFVLFHVYTTNITRNNLETIVELEKEHLASEVTSYFNDISGTLMTLSRHLEIYGTDDFMPALVAAQESNPEIASVYYLDVDNNMINSSGYVPDPDIDFRTRPWYVAAKDADGIIHTPAFLNATKDRIIVSIAIAVHDVDGALMGVIAADIDTRSVADHISAQTVLKSGFGMLFDANGTVIASPSRSDNLVLKNVNDVFSGETLSFDITSMQTAAYDGEDGVILMTDILDETYYLGIYIPIDEYNLETAMMFNIFAFLSFLVVTVWATVTFMYRKHMVEPVEHLTHDVARVDPTSESSYRLPITEHDLFTDVRETFNRVIDDNAKHMKTIKEQVDALYKLATYDQLTGLRNRRTYENDLVTLLSNQVRFALIMADINGLKLINDSFGHTAGDNVIQSAAALLKDVFKPHGTVYRIGGDEFVVIIKDADAGLVEDLKTLAADRAKSLHYRNVQISLSFGYDFMDTHVSSVLELQKNAENYMYRAKLMNRQSKRATTIDTILRTLYEKSNREQAHSLRVATYAKSLAKALGMPEDKTEEIRTAGLLHDIGKIAVEAAILNKPGKLTDSEWLEIRRHPDIGYNILSTVDELKQVAIWVLSHHERFDGEGYPRGIKGNAIPIEARIIAISDAFDAMTKDRTYRKELTKEEAVMELRRGKNTQFDARLVEVFIKHVLPDYN